jgi:ABC-type phosphate/phosphonate transport system permease subunit
VVTRAIRRSGREIAAVARGSTAAHADLRERVVAVIVVTLVLDLILSVLVLFAERHAPGTDIHSFGSALFWTTSQLLTVSSQMANPLTTEGRVLDVIMEIYAITVVATLAGSFGAFFHHRSAEKANR